MPLPSAPKTLPPEQAAELLALTVAMVGAATPDQISRALFEHLEVLGCNTVAVYTCSGDALDLVSSRMADEACETRLFLQPGRPEAEAYAERRPVCWSEPPGGGAARTFAALPLLAGDRVIGILKLGLVARPDPASKISPLLEMVASIVSRALERAGAPNESAERQLQLALMERDEFLSVAAHELNTPLTVLQLNVQNLRRKLQRADGQLDHQVVAQGLDGMAGQVQRLSRLLGHLLDVSRVRTGRLYLDREAFDLCHMVRETLARLSSWAAAKGSRIDLDQCQTIIGYWDRLRIEQVISNLLSNAIKYGEGHPITVSVHASGDMATVCVADRGIGIAEADRQRIFDRFQRATRVERADSFGLGLYITAEIVKAHGGSLEVQSELGRGSTFFVRLPLHRMDGDKGD